MGSVHILISPTAGSGRAGVAAQVVRAAAEAAGHAVDGMTGRTVEDSVNAARAAVAGGAERLIAVGGDGCLHIALQAVAGSDAVLGVVPAGTGNDFARAFGLHKLTVEQAAARALGPHRPVDVIELGHESGGRASPGQTGANAAGPPALDGPEKRIWVATSVTGGFSVDVTNRSGRLPSQFGKSRYVTATLLTAPRLRYRHLKFTVDGRRHEFTTALWAVANTRTFGGGMVISPAADPDDGLLDLVIVTDIGRIELLRMLPAVFKGSHIRHRKVRTLRGRRITIEDAEENLEMPKAGGEGLGDSDSSLYELGGDGEQVGWLPVTATAARAFTRFAADL